MPVPQSGHSPELGRRLRRYPIDTKRVNLQRRDYHYVRTVKPCHFCGGPEAPITVLRMGDGAKLHICVDCMLLAKERMNMRRGVS